ncbi:MAG: glutathione S-transferase [Porticoccaceae bacterium]|nr:MAG: glutathione S-transferase [Porticoccaceae bacterium]
MDLFLHHFDASPFAEKIRLALGFKGLAWRSVEIPMVMPKPDLTALTGGYRGTPVLQVGAHVYCDTARIAVELERRFPEPPLFPAGSTGLALALAAWSDRDFFRAGAALSLGTNDALPEAVVADRRAYFADLIDFANLSRDLDHHYAQFAAHLALVEAMLADGRGWVLGGDPSWADILAYFPLWMARGNVPALAPVIDARPAVVAWERRVAGLGHGRREPADAALALAVARACEPEFEPEVSPLARPALAVGDLVAVAPVGLGSPPVRGLLQRLTDQEIAILRDDSQLGRVMVHFPRIGYRVERAR